MTGEKQDPKQGKTGGLTARTLLFILIGLAVLYALARGGGNERASRPAVDCEVVAAEHKDIAEDLMVEYLRAHRTGNATMKAGIRDLAPDIEWPSCASAAGPAMRSWMDAVDADNQAGMTAADERFLNAFK